ncbi:hypothetical protein GGI20_005477 [Coemansia sp. BCRC 34301]|nr:hypothetical protein GGI20_005477 [Coemansia sp. BCRC 34301]
MSQYYAQSDLLNATEGDAIDIEVGASQAVATDDKEDEGEAEFDPLFEFADDVLEKPAANKQVQVRPSTNTVWRVVGTINWVKVLRFTATYLALPFVTGVMAGMGEIFANEFMYRWGWRGARPVAVTGRNGRVFPVTDSGNKARNAADTILI